MQKIPVIEKSIIYLILLVSKSPMCSKDGRLLTVKRYRF